MHPPPWASRFQGVPPPFPSTVRPARPVYRVPGAIPWFPVPMQAAIAFIAGTAANMTGTSGTINKPTGTVDGHLMICHISTQGQTGSTISGSWVFLYSDSEGSLWYRIANGEPASWTVSWAGSSAAVSATVTSWSGHEASDPILAYRVNQAAAAATHFSAPLFFQACDYMAVSMLGHNVSLGSQITGWSAGPTATNADRSIVYYKAFSNTAGFAGATWSGGGDSGTHAARVISLAIRESGNTALSMRSYATTNVNAGHTSTNASLPPDYHAGDLLVAMQIERGSAAGTARTLSATGWSAVTAQQSFLGAGANMWGLCYSRVATGSDPNTFSISSTGAGNARIVVVAFSTGNGGSDPSVLAGASTLDSVIDGTHTIPAITLADYAEDNILLAGGAVYVSGGSCSMGTFDMFDTLSTTNIEHAVGAKLNSGANPGSTTWATSNTGVAISFQIAVGVSLVGAGAYGQAFVLG